MEINIVVCMLCALFLCCACTNAIPNGLKGDSSWRTPNKLRDEFKHPDLRKLDVPFSTIGPMGMPLLAQAIRFNTTLVSLSFSGSGCGDIGVETMADTLMTNTALSSLDLGFSEIGPRGCDILAQALRFNPSLTSLSLGMNMIGDRGAMLLSRALQGNKLFISLDLRCNLIGSKGAESIAKMLEMNDTMTALNLQGNELGTKGSALLARCLFTNSTLHTLNLAQNNIRQVGELESPLVTNRFGGLQQLNLDGNGLEFARHNPLQRLVIFTNNMMGVERQRKPHIHRSTKLKRSTSVAHWKDMVQADATPAICILFDMRFCVALCRRHQKRKSTFMIGSASCKP